MRSKGFVAALVAGAALLATACGGGGSSPAGKSDEKGPAVVLAAAKNTAKAGSSKIAMAADFTVEGQAFAMTGDGAFDYAKQAGSMTIKMSGEEIPEAFGSGMEMRLLDNVIYMKFPAEFAQIIPGIKPWIKMSAKDLAGDNGAFPGFNSFANQDPSAMIAFLAGAKDVKVRGSESVRGTATTHYAFTVEIDKALEQLPSEERDAMRKMFSDAGIESLPMEAWIDEKGLTRRIKFAMDLGKIAAAAGASASPGAADGEMTMTMDFYDFGTPVSVSAPPAAEVSNYSELANLGSG